MTTVQDYFVKSTLILANADSDNDTKESASGFFYEYGYKYYLITNKHVLEFVDEDEVESIEDLEDSEISHPDEIYIYIRYNPIDITDTTREKIELFDSNDDPLWITHPDPVIDVVAIPLQIDLDVTSNRAYSKDNFVPDDIVVLGGDSAMALGFPKGLYDSNTYFPIIRDGLIATPPNLDYKGKPIFLMDAKMHDGTSGSPVLTQPSSIQRTEKGIAQMSGTPSYLLGVHSGPEYAPPLQKEDKKIDQEDYDPTLDLNIVWKAEVIEEMLNHH